jgi:hypothetical protein
MIWWWCQLHARNVTCFNQISAERHHWIRVARWYIFKPKIQIWVNFGRSFNSGCWCFYGKFVYSTAKFILWPFGTFRGLLVYFSVLVGCTEKNLATLLPIVKKRSGFLLNTFTVNRNCHPSRGWSLLNDFPKFFSKKMCWTCDLYRQEFSRETPRILLSAFQRVNNSINWQQVERLKYWLPLKLVVVHLDVVIFVV